MTCLDCGARSTGVLCAACARVAVALGYTPDERAAVLGAPTLSGVTG